MDFGLLRVKHRRLMTDEVVSYDDVRFVSRREP